MHTHQLAIEDHHVSRLRVSPSRTGESRTPKGGYARALFIRFSKPKKTKFGGIQVYNA